LCGETASISLYWVSKGRWPWEFLSPYERSDGKPPEPRHPLEVVAPILVLLLAVVLLAVVLLVWGG
jgi:hypothetical protein